jgi:hypothetical protein
MVPQRALQLSSLLFVQNLLGPLNQVDSSLFTVTGLVAIDAPAAQRRHIL